MSKSKNRRRTVIRRVRLSPEEDRTVLDKAKAVGGISALFRTAAMDLQLPKSKTDQQAVVQILTAVSTTSADARDIKAEAGKEGSNLNQIAHMINAGRSPERLTGLLEECLRNTLLIQQKADEVLTDMLEIRHLCMKGLGFEAERKLKAKKAD